MDKAWLQSRYDKAGPGGTGADYINCPIDRAQYDAFVDALLEGRSGRIQGVGGHALFRRLPADRGDGGARARDAAARADEADSA
jgi:folate-dependent tRNA-U54 methylase TrmFO/GidA